MIQTNRRGKTLIIAPSGNLNVFRAGELAELLSLKKGSDIQEIIVDLLHVDTLDSAPITVLSIAHRQLKAEQISLRIVNASENQLDMMKRIAAATGNRRQPERVPFAEELVDRLVLIYDTSAEFVALMYDATVAAFRCIDPKKRPPKGAIVEQCIYCGVDALPIILLLSALIGLILGFQAAYQLQRFGASIFIADLVGISGVREFSPLMSAIIIAGRSGASIAAELGTMKVQEEIDALRAMGLNPLRFLVLPRIAALIITLPALTLISSFIVITGGLLIANLMLDIQVMAYLQQTIKVIKFSDWVFGLSKSFVFAWIISLVGCFCGMSIRGGASEVGTATTKSVVASIFLLIVIDSFFAMISTLLKM